MLSSGSVSATISSFLIHSEIPVLGRFQMQRTIYLLVVLAWAIYVTRENRLFNSRRRIASPPDSVQRIGVNLWSCAYALTAMIGAWVVWNVGHRGIYLYDQSSVFDGAWRILQGQVLYRDFFTPYGPVVFLIQSLFFRVTGVDFSSLVLSAAVSNSIAVLCVIWLLRRLFPDPIHRPTAIAAGLVTATGFQAPFGTLWFEQTGFLFNLLATACVVESISRRARLAMGLRVAAGCFLAVSVLSKHSAGVVFLPVTLGVVVLAYLPDWKKIFNALGQIASGVLIVSAVFGLWLWLVSSFTGFWHSVIVMGRVLAGQRFSLIDHVWDLILLRNTLRYVLPALLVFLVFAVSRGAFSERNRLLASWILISGIFLQNLFASITLDQTINSIGFVGLINGLAFGLFFYVFKSQNLAEEPREKYWAKLAIPLLSTFFLFYLPTVDSWFWSSKRVVQEFEYGAVFEEPLNVKGASRLVWGEPQVEHVTRKDFEDLNAWLDEANANFFVFTSSTILYGLHQRVSPQPWLFFTPEHSFLMSDILNVDTTVVDHLKKNNVTTFLLEKTHNSANERLLDRMPKLHALIHDQFEKTKEFGIYEVWTLRNGTPLVSIQDTKNSFFAAFADMRNRSQPSAKRLMLVEP